MSMEMKVCTCQCEIFANYWKGGEKMAILIGDTVIGVNMYENTHTDIAVCV